MRIYSLFFYCLFLLSCTSPFKKQEKVIALDTIKINPENVNLDVVFYSQLFDSVSYYPIPTNENFIIGNIDKLLILPDYFIVSDKKITYSVFIFDKIGNPILQLKKNGSGYGEYIHICDLSYDYDSQQLVVYCNVRQKLIWYDLKGNFIKEEDFPYNVYRVEVTENGLLSYCEYRDNKQLRENGMVPNLFLKKKDSDSFVKSLFFDYPVDPIYVWSSECRFSRFNNTVGIKPDHCNYIYHVVGDRVLSAYYLDFGWLII